MFNIEKLKDFAGRVAGVSVCIAPFAAVIFVGLYFDWHMSGIIIALIITAAVFAVLAPAVIPSIIELYINWPRATMIFAGVVTAGVLAVFIWLAARIFG